MLKANYLKHASDSSTSGFVCLVPAVEVSVATFRFRNAETVAALVVAGLAVAVVCKGKQSGWFEIILLGVFNFNSFVTYANITFWFNRTMLQPKIVVYWIGLIGLSSTEKDDNCILNKLHLFKKNIWFALSHRCN